MRYHRADDRATGWNGNPPLDLVSPRKELVLLAASPSVFVATEQGSPLHLELTGAPSRQPSPVLRRASAMASDAGACLAHRTKEALRLPGWGAPLRSADVERLRRLQGATLLFPDTEPAVLSDLAEFGKLRRLGVRTLVTGHVAQHDAFVRLEIRRFSRLRRLLHALYLWAHAAARFASDESPLARLFFMRPYHVERHRWETPGLPGIRRVDNTDLCDRYALFQGFTQLPPIPVSHEDIARRGGGGYSVWHQHLVFSHAADGRRFFMLVPRNRWTEPFLEIVSETSSPIRAIEKRWVELVEEAAVPWRRRDSRKPCANRSFVVLTHCLAPGGAERQWCYLAIGLKQLGHEVSVVATHDVNGSGSHYLPLLERHGIAFIALDEAPLDEAAWPDEAAPLLSPYANPFGPRLERLARLLARLRPAAVFAQLDAPNILAAIAGHIADAPRIVLSFRNYNPTHFPYIYQDWMLPCYRALASSARIVLAGNSHAANRDYARWIGLPESAVHTVPNAIDATHYQPPGRQECAALRASLGIGQAAPVIIGVFRLSEEKRPFDFLEVCRQVRKALPELRVLIVGEGPLEDRLKQTQEPWISMLGRRTDVAHLLHSCDLLLLTSSHEGMPNVVMEAQLAGLPVVASRTGGLADCVQEEASAILVEPGEIAGFVQACLRILGDPQAGRAMGLRGAQWMREEFTIARMTRRYLELADG